MVAVSAVPTFIQCVFSSLNILCKDETSYSLNLLMINGLQIMKSLHLPLKTK